MAEIRDNSGSPLNEWVRHYLWSFWNSGDGRDEKLVIFVATVESMWRARNDLIFRGVPPNPIHLMSNIDDNDRRCWPFMEGKKRRAVARGMMDQRQSAMVFWATGCQGGDALVCVQVDGSWKKTKKKGKTK